VQLHSRHRVIGRRRLSEKDHCHCRMACIEGATAPGGGENSSRRVAREPGQQATPGIGGGLRHGLRGFRLRAGIVGNGNRGRTGGGIASGDTGGTGWSRYDGPGIISIATSTALTDRASGLNFGLGSCLGSDLGSDLGYGLGSGGLGSDLREVCSVQWNPTLGEALVKAAGRYEGTTHARSPFPRPLVCCGHSGGLSRSGCDRSSARLFLFLG
jgi:hypothetical protein